MRKNTNHLKNPKIKGAATEHEGYIVAIGASAGGLEAIQEFFDNIQIELNASFIIIQHLSPDYKSMLVELVAKHTNMQVFEAEDKMIVQPNCIYVIPPKKLLTIEGSTLILAEKQSERGPNTAIDYFLYSLAAEKGEKAIAIILSGTGTDGTKGIEAVKQNGGFVIIQEPQTAKFDGMPNSALATDFIDLVLPPKLMPAEIHQYLQDVSTNGLIKFDEPLLQEVFKLLYKSCEIDFSNYKRPTILRRMTRRMQQSGFKKIEDYIEFLNQHPEECSLLVKDFLIGVTKFFRDKEAFEFLEENVLPIIVSNKNNEDGLKIWVAACSTGEEAYSLAILIDRYLNKSSKQLNVKIFASDIDGSAVEYASKGSYPLSIAKDLNEDILSNYFTKQGKKYIINQRIRKQIVFAKHNIFKDPPFIKNDLISCRNMLIYMNAALQKKVLTALSFSLSFGGYLLLGSSENATLIKSNFEEISSKWKIYRKMTIEKLSVPDTLSKYSELDSFYAANKKGVSTHKTKNAGLTENLKELIAEYFGFAAFYLDKNYEVKEAIGNYKRYLSLPEKELNLNLLKMVPADLSFTLSMALRQSVKENSAVVLQKIKVKDNNKSRSINILVKNNRPDFDNPYITVVLSENISEAKALKEIVPRKAASYNSEYILQLEAELNDTKNNLQVAVESLETANEELQSSNEELLSANEELQSSNEELQSLNEELHTLNNEYQLKIKELTQLNDDLNNYFRSTDIGQIFVDQKLRIRKFNPAAKYHVNLIESDIGRPISHISTNIQQKNLLDDIHTVLKTEKIIEKEITLINGKHSLMRILPYLKQDGKSDGVVITFIDISAVKDLDNIIKGVFNSTLNAIMAFKAVRNERSEIVDLKFIAVNYAAEEMIGSTASEVQEKSFRSKLPEPIKDQIYDQLINVVQTGAALHKECELKGKWYELVAVKMMDGLVATFTDVTEKKLSEEAFKNNYYELIDARNKLKELNEALESKVEQRTKALSESEERFRLITKATNDALWDWNFSDDTLWLSNTFYSMFGYKKEKDIVNRSFWIRKIHPDDKKRITESIHNAIKEKKEQWSEEYRFRKADGGYATILDRGYILKYKHNAPYRMLASMFDVTALRKAEEMIAATTEEKLFLADSIPLIVWMADRNGNVDFLNAQFTAYTGQNIEEGLDHGWQEIVHAKDLASILNTCETSFKYLKDFAVEFRLRTADGKYRWNLLRARTRLNKKGEFESWVGSVTDIHEQKTTEAILEAKVEQRTKELKEMNKDLERSNNELQQFASVASHDMKEPLRKIQVFSNLIKDRFAHKIDGEVFTYVEKIHNSSRRMSLLIDDLLNFSKLSDKNLFELTDLNKVVDGVLNDFEHTINEKQAKIEVAKFPVIEVSPAQMRQLFQNIVSNALKFSKKELQPFVRINCEKISDRSFEASLSKEGDYCLITVTDNGIGFDNQYADKIFTIFQRLHGRAEYDGTGIGLAIVKKIVEKHNGLIKAESRKGIGAKFSIILPCKQLVASSD